MTMLKADIIPHISVWGSSFVGCHPARLRPSLRPSVLRPSLLRPSLLRPSLTHTIILSSDLFPSHTIISSSHAHTLILSSHISHSHTQSSHHLTHTHTHLVLIISHTHTLILSSYHLFLSFLSFPTSLCGGSQSLQKGLRRALSPLVPLAVRVAGAVSRASRRACGARCRRRSIQSLQKGLRRALSPLVTLAVLVAGCLRGRRSIQSLQKGLRRALSPLVPLAAFRVAGAVSRASRRACGARCRRWCRLLSSWQAQ